ncbi:cytochrome P450 7B1 isoform X1 [Hemiscyllium ocellatum]|uniref:cytochrome P450 7B1 isoform X1 n=2 Tax=Hemiscyllium ocellatum TaxID=170820 RepID=UPI0029675680|nr:cytochrome P450 7B1 isoform X1 [Hemiscyllium ocellatum]
MEMWFLLAVLLVVAALSLGKVLLGRIRRPGEPPLEQGWIPYFGKAFEFHHDSLGFLLSRQQRWGDVFTVYIAGKYMTFILNPFLYQFVVQCNKQLDFQGFSLELSAKVFGHPYLNDPKIPVCIEEIQKLYSYLMGEELNILNGRMMKNLQNVMKQEQLGPTECRTEGMYSFCCRIIIEATYLTLYGKAPKDEQEEITELKKKFIQFDKMFPYLVARIPIELLGNTKLIRRELTSYFTSRRLDQRLNLANVIKERKNFLETYSYLQDHQRAAHHFAFLWAALGNTVPAVFWALYYLVKNPEAHAAVCDEIQHVFQAAGQRASPDFNISLTREHLDSMVILGSAIKESFRLCSASMNIRTAQEDFTLNLKEGQSIKLRKGDWVVLYPQILHMDPEVYENPEVYKYNRFVENGSEKTAFYKRGRKLRYYLMPFGSGSSMCPGRHFAVSEIKMFLSIMLATFDLEIIEGEKPVGLNNDRAGLGIVLPDSDVQFRYKWHQ